MKSILIAASILLSAASAVAEPVVVPSEAFVVPQVAQALAQKCQPDCLVLNREDWAALMEKVKQMVKEEAKKNI